MGFALNEDQGKAVAALRGLVLIQAGAGSGKTRTLAERFSAALEPHVDEGWEPASVDELLTITFTEKAAAELAERIRATLRALGKQEQALEVDGAWISTIHGFCARVLRRYALEAGLDPAFSVADTVEAGRLRREAFEGAARAVLESPEGEALFAGFGFDEIGATVERIATTLVSRDLTPSDLELEELPDAVVVYREALRLFTESAAAIGACDLGTATATKQYDACERTLASLCDIDPESLPAEDLARRVWEALSSGEPKGRCRATQEHVERLKAEVARLTADAAAAASAPYARALRRVVAGYAERYERAKRERGKLDFDDLQSGVRTLFKERPDIKERIASGLRLAMVDEFQDTDRLQLEIVQSVAEDNLCTVGDERQSIYRFRGADLDVYRGHVADMLRRGARRISLKDNYRSHADVLDFANAVFGSDALFGAELLPLVPRRIEPEPPLVDVGTPRIRMTLVDCSRAGEASRAVESATIADQFAELRDRFGVRPSDMVVLVRAYTHADAYADALRERGFETMIVGGGRFFSVREVVHLRSFLRAVANPLDDRAIAELLISSMGRLSDDALWRLANPEDGARRSLWAALAEDGPALDAEGAERAGAVRGLVERARERVGRAPLSELLLRAVEESDLDLILLASGDSGRQAYASVLKLARMADEFESAGGAGPAEFESYLAAKEAFKDHESPASLADDDSPAVTIMSIHASKGLEFPVVAVPELGTAAPGPGGMARWQEDGERMKLAVTLPSSDGGSSQARKSGLFSAMHGAELEASNEEMKRLFYVACTRAREVLVLTGSGKLDKEVAAEEARSMLERLRLALVEIGLEDGDDGPRLGGVPVAYEELSAGDVEANPVAEDAEDGAEPKDASGGKLIEGEAADPPDRSVEPCAAEGAAETPAPIWEPPPVLSYSDLGLFERCAKRFWAEKILRLGRVRASESGDARTFGSAVHAVLQLVDSEGRLPSEERTAALARHFELDDGEVARLRAATSAFVASALGRELAAHEHVRREWPFAIEMGEGAFLFAGSIDAYGRSGAGGLIVDYKTGVSGEESELRDRYELQARCYALVALRDGCERVRVAFVRPEAVGADGEPQQVTFEFASDDAARIGQEIETMHDRMRAPDFEALGQWDDFVCGECPVAGGVCPVEVPRGRR